MPISCHANKVAGEPQCCTQRQSLPGPDPEHLVFDDHKPTSRTSGTCCKQIRGQLWFRNQTGWKWLGG